MVLFHGFIFHTGDLISCFYVVQAVVVLMVLCYKPVVLSHGFMFQSGGLSHGSIFWTVVVLMVLCYKPVVLSHGFILQACGFSVQHSRCPCPRAEQGTGRRDLQRNHPLLERFLPPG